MSCADVLEQFGVQATENDVVHYAVEHQECEVVADHPAMSGGTTPNDQIHILTDHVVPSHLESGESLEGLANSIEQGHGVIAEVNAGWLWNNAGAYENGMVNDAIVVTGVARDPQTGAIQGFFINDSGNGQSNRFVNADTMTKAWLVPDGTGKEGFCVVTDAVRC